MKDPVTTFSLASLPAGSHNITVEYAGNSEYRSCTATHNITIITPNVTEINCTTSTTDWISMSTTCAISILDSSTCIRTTNSAYGYIIPDYAFNTSDTYDVHMEIYITSDSGNFAIRWNTSRNGTLANSDLLEYYNEGGFPWKNVTRRNGNDTIVSTNLSGKQIKTGAWIDVDFKIIAGQIYASYTMQNGNSVTDEFVGSYSSGEFWFGFSGWNSNNGSGCKKFTITKH